MDPLGQFPIACSGGLFEGDPCDDEDGPVNSIGCCDAVDNALFYCTDDLGGMVGRVSCE